MKLFIVGTLVMYAMLTIRDNIKNEKHRKTVSNFMLYYLFLAVGILIGMLL